MLSVPPRWISSAAKHDLPSRRLKKSISSDHETHMTETHVEPSPTVHTDTRADQQNNARQNIKNDDTSGPLEDGKGKLIDCSV